MASISSISGAQGLSLWGSSSNSGGQSGKNGAPASSVAGSQSDNSGQTPAKGASNPSGLTDKQKQEVDELKKRDADVRAHEEAHMAAGGQFVRGGAMYTYQQGPDGNEYAVGGEVSIDTSAVSGDPKATIQKMETVQRAALAPADPSGQDRAVAAAAAQEEAKAQQELTADKSGSGPGQGKSSSSQDGQNSGNQDLSGTGSQASNLQKSAPLLGYSNQGKALSAPAHGASSLNYII